MENEHQQRENQQLWGKGSGSTACLSSTLQDNPHFQILPLPFSTNALALSATFAVATDQEGNAYLWGTIGSFNPSIVGTEKAIKIKEKVLRLSCGW